MAAMAQINPPERQEVAARSSEPSPREMLRRVENHGQIGLWSIDLKTGGHRLSDGFYRITGLDPATTAGDVLRDLFHPDDMRIREEIVAALLAGIPVHRECRIVRPDRAIRWVELKAEIILDAQARPARADGIILDITGRHEAGTLIRRSEARYQGLVRAIASVVWTATRDGFAHSCPGWSDLTGQTEFEWSNGGWSKAVHPEDRMRSWNSWSASVSANTPYDEDFRLLCADGRYRWFNSRGVPIFNEDRTVREWVGVMIEMSPPARAGPSPSDPIMTEITGSLVRCARAMLDWSICDLARAAGVSGSSIKRFEENGGGALRERTRSAIRTALEQAGITFIAPKTGQTGVIFEPDRAEAVAVADLDV